MRSVRFKITAITIAATLITTLFGYVVSYFTLRAENDRSSVGMMNVIGDDTKKTIEKYTENIEMSVEMAANLAIDTLDSVVLVECGAVGRGGIVFDRTEEQKRVLYEYLTEYCEEICRTFSSVASHTHGIMTYYYCINPEISEDVHGFFYSRVGKAGFFEREPLDARTLDPDDTEHTTWYYTPVKRGRPTWVGPYSAHFLGEMQICSYVVPIYKSGALIGVLGMDISVETITEQVEDIRVYETGFAALFSDDHRVIYHPEMEYNAIPVIPDVPNAQELLTQNNNGDKLIRYTAANGVRRQMSFCTLSNGMKLIITAPTSEINASWSRLVMNNVYITFAIITVFAVLMMLIMRFLTRPMLDLAAASRSLAEGNYDTEVSYKGKDEIGVLTDSFSSMRDQLKKNIEDLNRRINTDALTGLPNMRYFFTLGEKERDRILETGGDPVLLFFDLIGMKHYNSQYGFDEGDRIICGFGSILAEQYGENCVCRYSDDHFAAVTDAADLDKKLRRTFLESEYLNGGRSLPVRAGVYPNSIEEVPVSVACDRAKYACDKHRSSFVSGYYVFDEGMCRQIDDVRYIISRLDRALDERRIRVFYQPIIRSESGKVCDVEALSRWMDPERGMLSPAVFIPVLENARLIYRLDLYVLDRILENMLEQKAEGRGIVPHSVNLSRSDFDSCDIVEEIRQRVDRAGIPHEMLTIEVTESMVGSDFDFMKERIQRFQSLGFRVWMDDFGSGYSSLDVLQYIHIDLLKFDMRFMHRFEEGEESKIILTELIRMAENLGIETVCEGVETEEQAGFLRTVGSTKLQGYYFSKPVPFEEIVEKFGPIGEKE